MVGAKQRVGKIRIPQDGDREEHQKMPGGDKAVCTWQVGERMDKIQHEDMISASSTEFLGASLVQKIS